MKVPYGLSALLLSLVLLIGASGNFREYGGERDTTLQIVGNNTSYVAFTCPETEIVVKSGETFAVMTITNNLIEGADFYIKSQGDLIKFENPTTIESGESAVIYGTFNGSVGNYSIPITIDVQWINGSAYVESCTINISDPLPEIEKTLLKGNQTVKTGVKESWTFRITLTNYGSEQTYTVKDTIPAEYEVINVVPSNGTYALEQPGHGKMGPTKLKWIVTVENDEHVDVTVSTKLNPAGKQEFTCSGLHTLNSGAEIMGYGITSNGIMLNVEDD